MDKNLLATVRNRISDYHDTDEYLLEHWSIAIEVARHNGTIYDMDCMVRMSEYLGTQPSWDMYHALNEYVDQEDLLSLSDVEMHSLLNGDDGLFLAKYVQEQA